MFERETPWDLNGIVERQWYPELRNAFVLLVGPVGIEPTTEGL